MLQVTFAEVVRVLEGLGSSVPAAEAHGCLVGALCTSQHYSMERWLEEIIPDEERRNDDDSQQALRLLYADTLNALRGEEMEFEVLLPDDDIPLAERAGGLSQWCQGFLYGFGTGQAQQRAHQQSEAQLHADAYADADEAEDETAREDPDEEEREEQLPDTVTEILNDLTHIGRASVELDGDAASEAEEEAYAEVVEYVRVGVQLVHDEMIPAQATKWSQRADMDTDVDMDDSQDIDPSTLH